MRFNLKSMKTALAAGLCLSALAAGNSAAEGGGGGCPGGARAALADVDREADSLAPDVVEPTVAAAERIEAIVRACPSSEARVRAALVLTRGISFREHPTMELANVMARLCGPDRPCALAAIASLSGGGGIAFLGPEPSGEVSRAIVRVVELAPYEDVKQAALARLRVALTRAGDGSVSVTRQLSSAIRQVKECGASAATEAPAAPDAPVEPATPESPYARRSAAVAELAKRMEGADGRVFDNAGRRGGDAVAVDAGRSERLRSGLKAAPETYMKKDPNDATTAETGVRVGASVLPAADEAFRAASGGTTGIGAMLPAVGGAINILQGAWNLYRGIAEKVTHPEEAVTVGGAQMSAGALMLASLLFSNPATAALVAFIGSVVALAALIYQYRRQLAGICRRIVQWIARVLGIGASGGGAPARGADDGSGPWSPE